MPEALATAFSGPVRIGMPRQVHSTTLQPAAGSIVMDEPELEMEPQMDAD
jgi:hypothetical protein